MASGSTAGSIHEDTGEKDVYPKVHTPDLFYGDRKKFKAYYNQVRFYIWSDSKRTKKTLKNTTEKVIWATSFFRGNTYARFESYIKHYLDREFYFQYNEPVKTVMTGIEKYLKLLKQSYKNLNETRTAKLQLQKLIQTRTVPEYLTRFIQYALRVT
jgi:hypothetical protein